MIKEIGISESEFTSDCPEPEVSGGEDEAFDAGDHQRAGAHRAWFQGDVQGRPGQAVIANALRSLSKSLDFSMRGRIACGDEMIAPLTNHFLIQQHDGAYGDFPFGFGLRREYKGTVHAAQVGLSPSGQEGSHRGHSFFFGVQFSSGPILLSRCISGGCTEWRVRRDLVHN